MFFYEIWVRSSKYHSLQPLTYFCSRSLGAGTIVKVPLQNSIVMGFVLKKVERPKFKTKEIAFVFDLPSLPLKSIELAKWLISYYPASLGVITKQFLPPNIHPNYKFEDSYDKTTKTLVLPKLNNDQSKILAKITKPDTYLLYGITGSGKTRIYQELAINSIKNNKSVIILTPEISLTSQLWESFNHILQKPVFLVHSRLTTKEKELIWLKCLTSSEPFVLIGPRSALFYPVCNLGLIVLDEFHDSSYKEGQYPKYQTTRVAAYLSKLHRATLIMGSATPLIADYYFAKSLDKPILNLMSLAKGSLNYTPQSSLVDLKDRSNFTRSSLISDQLIASINMSLSNKEQALIYLNRRGTARLIFCENCGWEELCVNCNLPLTYHADKKYLICHSCGYTTKNIPTSCPVCNYTSVIFKTAGTKALDEELRTLFKDKVIYRFDSDNLKSEAIQNNYQKIISGEVDIIVGTQLIAKGFDFPLLSTVGIIQADTGLYLPDFSSREKSFELISQVLGRANRGHLEGRIVIQSYNPNSNILKYALNQNYKSFYKEELKERELYNFPPFVYLLKLSLKRSSPKSAQYAALKLKALLLDKLELLIEGPSPAFHEKFGNKFEWQLIVKAKNRQNLIRVISLLPSGWNYDIDPTDLL